MKWDSPAEVPPKDATWRNWLRMRSGVDCDTNTNARHSHQGRYRREHLALITADWRATSVPRGQPRRESIKRGLPDVCTWAGKAPPPGTLQGRRQETPVSADRHARHESCGAVYPATDTRQWKYSVEPINEDFTAARCTLHRGMALSDITILLSVQRPRARLSTPVCLT